MTDVDPHHAGAVTLLTLGLTLAGDRATRARFDVAVRRRRAGQPVEDEDELLQLADELLGATSQ